MKQGRLCIDCWTHETDCIIQIRSASTRASSLLLDRYYRALKQHYGAIGMQSEYNVPTILKFSDSFGNLCLRNQMTPGVTGGVIINLSNQPTNILWPGDVLTVEIEVDPAFDPTNYTIRWACLPEDFFKPISSEPKAIINITTRHVAELMVIQCKISSHNEWHRMGVGGDDSLSVF